MKRLLLALCLLFSLSLVAAERPNVIFILADDLGWGDLGCQGHPYAKTPSLDNASDFDGEDSSKAWLGGTHVRTKPLFWKTNTENSDPSMLAGSWKLHGSHRKKGTVTLYDLTKDPGEQNDLSTQEPEMLKKLTDQLHAWTATLPQHYEHGDEKGD